MKLRTWNTAVFGGWLIAVVVVVASHQKSKQGRIASTAQANSVTIYGPDVEWMKRLDAKQQISSHLLAGRTSLPAAAAAFRRLDDSASSRWIRAPQIYADAASDEEAYCRSVMAYLHTTVPTERFEEVVDRLQAELNARFPSKKSHATADRPS